jgi:hypothetical protein
MSKAVPTEPWQKNVRQEYRTEQVNMISKVLASLEPSATPASKMMLASQFETAVFKTASSFEEYGKIINKKLKKMQKNYKAPTALNSQQLDEQNREKIIQTKRRLKSMYGEKLELIVTNGKTTVMHMRARSDLDKAAMLSKHIDDAILWAVEIGAVRLDDAKLIHTGSPPVIQTRSIEEQMKRLEQIEHYLKTRLENIRSYVLKTTLLDQFFGEKLDEMERDLILNPNSEPRALLLSGFKSSLEKQGCNLVDLIGVSDENTAVQQVLERLGNIQKIISLAGSRGADDRMKATLAYIDRVRDICQIYLLGVTLNLQEADKVGLAGSFRKAHDAFNDAKKFLKSYYNEDSMGEESDGPNILLEDAWHKIMDYDKDHATGDSLDGIDTQSESKPIPKHHRSIMLKTKVLFAPNRPIPFNLIGALKQKGVEMIHNDQITYLVMKFGTAFEMYIYFSPLLVAIRAIPSANTAEKNNILNKEGHFVGISSSYKLLEYGISMMPMTRQLSYSSRKRNVGGKLKDQADISSVQGAGGIAGDFATVSELVSRRLQYASSQATRCLRRCFADKVQAATSDFDTEISEGMAIMNFVNLARATYMGHEQKESFTKSTP